MTLKTEHGREIAGNRRVASLRLSKSDHSLREFAC
jgi:hypothetical protein